VDCGPIIAQRGFPIPSGATSFDLYRLFHFEAYSILAENVRAILAGDYIPRQQPSGGWRAHRRSDVDFSDTELVDFHRPAAEVARMVRALVFPPFQLPTFRGIAVTNATALPPTAQEGPIGTVLTRSSGAVVVRCVDGEVYLELDGRSPVSEPPSSG
jgi:methionyl-tRNA formyltransferase